MGDYLNRPAPPDRFISRVKWITIAVITVLVSWYALSWADRALVREHAAPRPVVARGDLASDEKATINLFERSRDSVVYIAISQKVMDFWSSDIFSIPRGTGSGFVWDDRGHIVTNFHVVNGASEARVRLSDGHEYKASLIGTSPAHDLAVLKISDSRHRPLPLGTSGNLKVGQRVYAIGNPFGLDWTLTTGIVSALNRSLKTESGAFVEHLIQTDAAINPGNSGGPLLDSAGRLIGVNTAIYSPSGASAGVGFAVPVDTVNRVVPQLISKGKYIRATLGIETNENLNEAITSRLGIKGVLVLRVKNGSAASTAGLRGARMDSDGSFTAGDIITAINGKPVDTVETFLSRLDDYRVGETVRISVLRDSSHIDRNIVLKSE